MAFRALVPSRSPDSFKAPLEKRMIALFGDIQTTQFQWISDEEWLFVQSGDCEEVRSNFKLNNFREAKYFKSLLSVTYTDL
jgi:hypothetical protein